MEQVGRVGRSTRRLLAVAILLTLGTVLIADQVIAQTASVTKLSGACVGGYSEDITFVSKGPLTDHIVFTDGYEAWGVPGQALGNAKARKLFDYKALPILSLPTGIEHITSRKLFVVNDNLQLTSLFLVDHQGRARGTLSLNYLGGYLPNHFEGIGYVPPSAGRFPDHLVLVTVDPGFTAGRLEVVDLQGQVVDEILPVEITPGVFQFNGCPADSANLGSVTYLPGDRLLLSFFDANASLCTIDFDGVSAGAPQLVATPDGMGEGVTRLADGRIVALGYPQRLLFFDQNLNRLTASDRNDVIGLGLNVPRGIAWDSVNGRHLISHGTGDLRPVLVSAVPTSLAGSTPVIDLLLSPPGPYPQSRHIEFLSDELLIALAHRGQGPLPPPPPARFRGILLYDGSGVLQGTIDSPLSPPLAPNRPFALTYVPGLTPGMGQFVVVFLSEPSTLYFLDRMTGLVTGSPVDLSTTTAALSSISAITYFDPGSGGRLLVLGPSSTTPSSSSRAVVVNLAGVKQAEFNYRTALGLIGPTDLGTMAAGPTASHFSVVNGVGGELMTFEVK